ncbi:MAG: family 20 glycosylhydrolase [Oscillospiraceae bacterium]|nr:family 20 glycosylhydrolase [Oscillospiraceae bacterium]
MYTAEDIKFLIQPVPQQVKAGRGKDLKILPTSKFTLTAPKAECGPVKTAKDKLVAFLQHHCGADCFAEGGIAITLELSDEAPKKMKRPEEGYRLKVTSKGITVTGFGESGLFYGVGSLLQICVFDCLGAQIPAVEVLDWPDSPFRGFMEECRYGSNVMEKQDWLDMIDDLADKKYNHLQICLYGCWKMQYDKKVPWYLYLPLKDYPLLETPQTIKYYSPTENKWYNYETLPPIYRDNFFGELVAYGKQRGVTVYPLFNSLGHNILLPTKFPETAPVDADGVRSKTGFCTSSEETYKLLFSIYDQLIDEYLLPNDIHTFSIGLDEVFDEPGVDPEDPYKVHSPWCQCEKCRDQDRGDIFINHTLKLATYLKNRGMTTIVMYGDMVTRENKQMRFIGEQFQNAIKQAGLEENILLHWWNYLDQRVKFEGTDKVAPKDYPLRVVTAPWNGYYIWSLLTNPMRNVQLQAESNHCAPQGEGVLVYAMWSKSYDRIHDCASDYCWNYQGTGTVGDVTARYVKRHFAPLYKEALHAYNLIDWITEESPQKLDKENPENSTISNYDMLRNHLSYYTHCYFSNIRDCYPRRFPGCLMEHLLTYRYPDTRNLHSVAAMAKEALAIFRKAANTAGCDKAMADRMAYEVHNYLVIAEDALALFEIYDLTQSGNQKDIAPIARARQNARLALMTEFEKSKTLWEARGAGLRNQSVWMQMFADIANYIENTDEPQLDLIDIRPIMSQEHWMLR